MPNSRRRRHARRLTRVLAASLLPLAGLFAGLVPALAIPGYAGAMTSCRNWTGTPPVIAPDSEGAELHSVAVLSSCNVWTVGETFGPGPDQALIEHWNGSSWKVMPITQPADADFDLTSIQALSPSDIWAVGHIFGTSVDTLALHWDGKSWTQTPSLNPQPTSEFTGVRAVSTNNVWAVGIAAADGGDDQTLIEHWNGTVWKVTKASFPGDLLAVGASGRHGVWAVGQVFTGHRDETLTLHWDGHSWVRKMSPSPGSTGDALNSVVALSASNVWAVGFASNDSGTVSNNPGTQTLILHWNGRKWWRVKSPSPGGFGKDDELSGVAAISASNIVAVGTAFVSNQTIIVQWNGRSWVRTPSPRKGVETQLLAVGASSAANVWAVGDFSSGGSNQVFATRFASAGARAKAAGF